MTTMVPLSSRRVAAVLSCSLLVGGVAGCGSSGDGGSTSSSKVDGRTLLNEATLTPNGDPLTSGTVGISVSGTVNAPKDKDIKKLSGKVGLTVSSEKLGQQKTTPPVKITFDVDGSYTSGSGKASTAKYSGGISYLDSQLYVNWKDKDYAFGQELTKQFAAGFTQGLKKDTGSTDDLKTVTADPGKLLSTMDLEPGTWLKDVTVADGPTLDGAPTYAVSGPVDLKATAADISDGLKKLPAAFPNVPGLKSLEKMGDVKDSDIAEAEKSLTKRNLTVYIGKEDKVQRRIKLDIAGKDTTGESPTDIDLSIQLDTSKMNQPQGITAPKNAAPVTDLFMELQKDFPGIGGLLGG